MADDTKRGVPALASTGASEPAAAATTSTPSTIGRFRVDRRLGEGGMGAVFLATDPALGRPVAIKVVRGSGDRRRSLREAQATAKLIHDNVVVVHEVGEHDDQIYIAMEYVAGDTLRTWQAGRSWRDIVAMYVRAGRGLQAAHDAGLVHRDFKPDNVLVGSDGRVRVSDFGLVSAAGETAEVTTGAVGDRLTQTGAVMGTPRYMAPEQHRGEAVDARADQFAFCVALYEALYHQVPFAGDTIADLARAVMAGEIRPVQALPVHGAIVRGLSASRDDRFSSMRELLAALQPRPRPRWPIAIAAGLAVAIVGVAVYVSVGGATTPALPDAAETRDLSFVLDLRTAAVAFDNAQEDYRAGRYAEAAQGFQDAYAIRPFPQFLYNIAASYHELGKRTADARSLRKANAFYRRYLTEMPLATDRATVEKRIAELDAVAQRIETGSGSASITSADLPADAQIHGLAAINSDPQGAELWIDDMRVPIGTTPWTGWLDGEHRVRFVKPGYATMVVPVTTSQTKLMIVQVTLGHADQAP